MAFQVVDTLCALCGEFAHVLAETVQMNNEGRRMSVGGRFENADWLDSMTRWSGVFKHHACLADLISTAQTCHLCRLLQTSFESLADTESRMPEYCSGWLGFYFNGSPAYTTISGGLPAAKDVFRAGFSESLSRMPPRQAPDNNPALMFRLCLREGECPLRGVSNDQGRTSRRIPADGTSPAIFEMASGWLSQCVDKHANCRETAKSSQDDEDHSQAENRPLPTRVIDVDPELGDSVKLYVTQGEKKPYVALSHCWGGNIPNKTVRNTLDKLRHGFPISSLPQNFQDAVLITRKLNIRYVWIDALCIIQDDAADWAHEADLMDEVYAWSTVTITGLDSPASTAGILSTQRLASVDIPHKPLAIQASTDSIPVALGNCVLSKRAWCLQERFLAPRLLHFGAAQIFWECRESIAAEDDQPWDWVGSDHAVRSLIQLHRDLGNDPPVLPRISLYWSMLIEEYSLRNLTFGMDKLPAMLGTSQMFQTKYPSLGQYIAGLWSGDLARGLCWGPSLVQFKEDRKRPGYAYNDACALFSRPEQARAPSWSWASVDGSLYFPCSRAYITPWNSEIEVVDINMADKGTAGTLILRGKVGAFQYVVPKQGNMALGEVGHLCALGNESQTFACCVLDFDRHVPRECHVLLTTSIGYKSGKFVSFVVLEKVAESKFQRIGISTAFFPAHLFETLTNLINDLETQELSIE